MSAVRARAVLVALAIAGLGAVGVVFQALHDPGRALIAWVAAYGFGLGTALGALVLVMVFHVTGARWPLVLTPRLTAIASALPVFAVLFVPIVLGLREVYPWARDASALEALDAPVQAALEHQRTWNNPSFFLGRSMFYLVTWSALALLLRLARIAHARAPSQRTLRRQRVISGAGLPIVALTLTFASFDWFMSVEAGWVSNMYGLYFFCGGLMSAVSLVALLCWLAEAPGLPAPGPSHFLALGRLMLMSVILWAYIGFFQLMLVWVADLEREVSFFVARSRGSFVVLDGVLLVGHFVLPFLALLSRPLKRSSSLLALVGAWLIVMNAADLIWLVLPSRAQDVGILDLAPFLAVSGVAFAYGAQRFEAHRAVDAEIALRDPAFAESLEYRSP